MTDRKPNVDEVGEANNGSPDDSVYDPSTIEVTRGREQGLGMGAEDLARQRDPKGAAGGDAQRLLAERVEPSKND